MLYGGGWVHYGYEKSKDGADWRLRLCPGPPWPDDGSAVVIAEPNLARA